jgi:formate-dependent nitrite reductase membrane component NrfD
MPALKPSPWSWKVTLYMAIAGTSGGAQVIASVVRAGGGRDMRGVVRAGRTIGLAGSLVGAPLLIMDLKTPHRWYNMLRIFRHTSPLSIGSFVLTGFGAFSAATAAGAWAPDDTRWGRALGVAADLAQGPAAVTGALMTTYTASLLSGTSTPLWASATKSLAVQFASSGIASGAAALSLAEHAAGRADNAGRLDNLAFLATATGFAASMLSKQRYQEEGVDAVLSRTPEGRLDTAAKVVGYGVPLACHALNALARRPSPALSMIAAMGTLAGGFMMRHSIKQAGDATAIRPTDYLGFAQPRRLPPAERPQALPLRRSGKPMARAIMPGDRHA